MAAKQTTWLSAADCKLGAFLRALAFGPYAGTLALVLLCCALFLPGIASLPVTDRDEARFAQATRQMLETGNYIDIRFQDVPRYKKPIGIYWLQAASAGAASHLGAAVDAIWAYRIPSFLSALGAVLLIFWSARPIIGRKPALLAAALFASSLAVVFEAHIAKSDAALIASIVLMQGALFRLYLAPKAKRTFGVALLFWLGLGAGILIKGPISPGLALLTVAFLFFTNKRRDWFKNLHWQWGVPLLLAVTLPWFIAIGISSGGAFFKSSLGQDFAGKLQGGQESHWAPPGYYFLLFWWTFWPAALFTSPRAAITLWRLRRSRRALFLFAWILPFWVLIEAVPTKLPHYALPLYPAIAIAAALALHMTALQENTRTKGYRVSAIVWAAVAILQLAFIISVCWLFEAPVSLALVLSLGVFAIFAAIAFFAGWRSRISLMLAMAILSGIAFYPAAFRFALPSLDAIWISEKAAAARHALKACGKNPVAFAGFSEPSSVFLNGTETLHTLPILAADALAERKVSLAFVTWPRREEFERRFAEQAGSPALFLGCVDGVDINGRGPIRLQVYARPEMKSQPGCEPVPETQCLDRDAVRWRRLLGARF